MGAAACSASMLPFVPRNGLLHFLHCRRRLGYLFSSASAAASVAAVGGGPSPNPQLLVEYLVNSCGLSAAEASKASKPLAHLKSMERPDAVLSFLRSHGFDDSHLRKMISYNPKLLCFHIEKRLAPKFRSLRDMGFSDSDLIEIIKANSRVLNLRFHRSLLPRLEIWEKLFGSRELLVKNMKKNAWFLLHNIQTKLFLNMSFLRDECGIPEQRISCVVKRHPSFILQKPESLRALVVRAEELGVPRKSTMLLCALHVLYLLSEKSLESKIKLMSSLGWSESEFVSAFRKRPTFLCFSEKELQKKMEFFVKEVGYTPSHIAGRPMLLLYSIKKRVIPRYRVMEMLKLKGLYSGRYTLPSILSLSEEKFMQKFVLGYKEQVPELLDIFVTGR